MSHLAILNAKADAPDASLELVGLDYIGRLVGDRTPLATRRWVERLRARGVLRSVNLAGSRKLRFRKVDVLRLVSGFASDPGPENGKGASVASAVAIS
jgi:hypothetical protein